MTRVWAEASADALVGLTLASAGSVLLYRRSRDVVGALLLAACGSWFVASFADSEIGAASHIGAVMQFMHRGFLLHAVIVVAVLQAGGQWLKRRNPSVALIIVVCSYLISAVRPLALAVVPTLLVGIVTGVLVVRPTIIEADRHRRSGLRWMALGLTLWVGAATVMRWLPESPVPWRIITYSVGIMVCAIAVVNAHLLPRPGIARAISSVEATLSSPEDALAAACGDSDLRLGFSDSTCFRDAGGAVLVSGRTQASTTIDAGENGRVLLTHRPGLLDDRLVRREIIAFAQLVAKQHRLEQLVRTQTAEVLASRNRLELSEKRAAAELADEIDQRVIRVVHELRNELDSAHASLSSEKSLVEDILAELTDTTAALQGGRADPDLAATLRALVARAPIPVELTTSDVEISYEAGRALAFVASEAVTNAAKHAAGSSMQIHLATDSAGRVELRLSDNGQGGAISRPGGGLEGLARRMSDIGGELVVRSERDQGTVLIARWSSA